MDRFRFAPPAFIAGVVPNANLSMTLYFESSPSSTNIVQAATNLAASAWQNVSTNITDGSGIWQFTDTYTSGSSSRFYRASTH